MLRVCNHEVPLWWCRRSIKSSLERTSITALKSWNCSRSLASARATPARSLGSQTMGGGAMSSGANSILDISSAWSANGSGGRRGGASGCVRAARSVAVRSSSVSVATRRGLVCEHSLHGRATKTETTYGLALDHVVDTAWARRRASWTSSPARRQTTPAFALRVRN